MMEPLATNRQCLIWLCICPADESTDRWRKVAHIICATSALTAIFSGFVSSVVCAWKFISIDVGRTMFAFTFLSGEIATLYMALIAMLLLRHKIDEIFKKLSMIYETRKCFPTLKKR